MTRQFSWRRVDQSCVVPNNILHACRLRRKAAEAEAELPAEPDEEDEEEEEEESEYETDSEDEGFGRALLKPVFVPKVWLLAGCHALPNLCHAFFMLDLHLRMAGMLL